MIKNTNLTADFSCFNLNQSISNAPVMASKNFKGNSIFCYYKFGHNANIFGALCPSAIVFRQGESFNSIMLRFALHFFANR